MGGMVLEKRVLLLDGNYDMCRIEDPARLSED